MEIKFYFNQTERDGELKDYVQKKVEKITKYLNNEASMAEIEIKEDKRGLFNIEIRVTIPGKSYISAEDGQTPEEACDLAYDDLVRQIKKDKKKRRTLQNRGAISIKKRCCIDEDARF